MEINNNDGRAKIIAYYLPQFYPCEFNDKWYGKGFTEWTNVGKAQALFRGHYQPKVPADLGYYDLRVPEVAEKQAELAREAGVFGFAYWHYWWAGKMLLNMPAERMLDSLKPEFPFMFAWANENWFKKLWDKDAGKDVMIMEQTYPGEVDNLSHFEYCLPFFKDNRYITYNGRPVFLIYHPLHFSGIKSFMEQWDRLIKEHGVAERFYWMAVCADEDNQFDKLKKLGFDCMNYQLHGERLGVDVPTNKLHPKYLFHSLKWHLERLCGNPEKINYDKVVKNIWINRLDSREDVAPIIIPNWDHTARSGKKGLVYVDSTPNRFYDMAMKVLGEVRKKKNKIVMMKSWNEWAEGNYMEPDLKFGKGYIEVLGKAVEETTE